MIKITVERIKEYLEGLHEMTTINMGSAPDSEYLKGNHFVVSDLLSFIKDGGKKEKTIMGMKIVREWLKE